MNNTPEARLARQLERERNAARATCAELVTDSNAVTLAESLHKVEAERDELRKVCDELITQFKYIAGTKQQWSATTRTINEQVIASFNKLPHVVAKNNLT